MVGLGLRDHTTHLDSLTLATILHTLPFNQGQVALQSSQFKFFFIFYIIYSNRKMHSNNVVTSIAFEFRKVNFKKFVIFS